MHTEFIEFNSGITGGRVLVECPMAAFMHKDFRNSL